MTQTLKEVIAAFEKYVPPYLAEADDRMGLQFGRQEQPIETVLVTLDVRPEVVEEAIAKGAQLILAKHAPIFRGPSQLTDDNPQTAMYRRLIQADIAVYAAHTNMDIMPGGLNDLFFERLGIQGSQFLEKTHSFALYKMVVYVPFSEATPVRTAAYAAGAGKLSADYTDCSFSVQGTGRFRPGMAANPTIGVAGELTKVSEERIELIVREQDQAAVIKAVQEAHPYEEPAIDLMRLENLTEDYGLGRVGTLPHPLKVKDFAKLVKERLDVRSVRMISANPEAEVKTVAVCGGSGEKFYPAALAKGADIYITADVYYHTAHDMLSSGLHVLDPGHYMEHHAKNWLASKMEILQTGEGWSLNVLTSAIETDPFQTII